MGDIESFIPDRSLYELGDQDLKELWDSEQFEMPLTEPSHSSESEAVWYNTEEEFRSVILNDRMMTDAALPGGIPIKHEHSYSLAGANNKRPFSPEPQNNRWHDDMETECYPVISMRPSGENYKTKRVLVKSEPGLIEPVPIYNDKSTPRIPIKHSSSSQSVLKHKTLLLAPSLNSPSKLTVPKVSIKVEPDSSSSYSLPPTPPSSYNSDSDGSLSPLHSSVDSHSRSNKGISTQNAANSIRQPISTPLISSQPKGASGVLVLTEEEKRTLIAEGYPIPTKLPLTKAEERSLKKIRRKIKNKISAQESRRKKKEYMDLLEKKVEFLASENLVFRKQVNTLETLNNNLQDELERLRYKLEMSSKTETKETQTIKSEVDDEDYLSNNIISVTM